MKNLLDGEDGEIAKLDEEIKETNERIKSINDEIAYGMFASNQRSVLSSLCTNMNPQT